MNSISRILKEAREEKGWGLTDIQRAIGIDAAQISRIENAVRLPTADQALKLAELYGIDPDALLVQLESDKIVEGIKYPDLAHKTLRAAEEKIRLGSRYMTLFREYLYTAPIGIESRRYIGSKAKLTDWIIETIQTEAPEARSFCDLFGGTGVVTNRALRIYGRVVVNDFLYSNNVIYRAFFGKGEWDRTKLLDIICGWNDLVADLLPENYFSEHYGGKFFASGTSKIIGHIRQKIEDERRNLTEKEYAILLATLIYNIDRHSNTVGHFDAYIKKPITDTQIAFRLIDAGAFDGVEIYREDANQLVREIEADIFYLDPPYNSRQYSRFYHLYETLVKWDAPELYGTALKPAPENMSRYCTTKAAEAFRDLASNMKAKYIAVSYNNTYHSKSKSSENKIRLETIERILRQVGETKIFRHSHKAFTTGKTEFEDHQEYLFITKVDETKRIQAVTPLLRGR